MVVGHGNVNIIELFLGNVFALIPGLFPGGSSSDKPFVTAHVDRGDITIEGMQGLKSPADSAELQVDLAAGGGGNIKLIVNANGFLGKLFVVCCLLFAVCCLLFVVVVVVVVVESRRHGDMVLHQQHRLTQVWFPFLIWRR